MAGGMSWALMLKLGTYEAGGGWLLLIEGVVISIYLISIESWFL